MHFKPPLNPQGRVREIFWILKNHIVKNFEGKIFGANNSNYIYSIVDGLLCINHQKIDTKKAFEEWKYLYQNQHVINPNLNNIFYLNIEKLLKLRIVLQR